MSARIVLVASNKGGISKTTTTAVLGDILARKMGKRVLLIDGDSQGNLSSLFGFGKDKNIKNHLGVLLQSELKFKKQELDKRIPLSFFINPCQQFSKVGTPKTYESLSIIASNDKLESVYASYRNEPNYANGIARKLLIELSDSGDYDYIIIDTQPILSYMLGQFMLGSDYVLVPVTPTKDALEGAEAVGVVFNNVLMEKKEYAKHNTLRFLGIYFNQVRANTIALDRYTKNLSKYWSEENPVLSTSVPLNQAVVNAANDGYPVTCQNPKASASKAFNLLAAEIDKKIDAIEAEQKN